MKKCKVELSDMALVMSELANVRNIKLIKRESTEHGTMYSFEMQPPNLATPWYYAFVDHHEEARRCCVIDMIRIYDRATERGHWPREKKGTRL